MIIEKKLCNIIMINIHNIYANMYYIEVGKQDRGRFFGKPCEFNNFS